MWTFTFREVLSIPDTRKRWNHLLTLIRRRWPNLCGLRVFELHPKGHGLHVHMVTNRFVDVTGVRTVSSQAGWGRIHVEKIPKARAAYLAKYLSKKRPECFRHWRLWAGFGKGWSWTKVSDVAIESVRSKVSRSVFRWFNEGSKLPFQKQLELVELVLNATIREGWTPGLGPGDRPYWMCTAAELRLAWDSTEVKKASLHFARKAAQSQDPPTPVAGQ